MDPLEFFLAEILRRAPDISKAGVSLEVRDVREALAILGQDQDMDDITELATDIALSRTTDPEWTL